MNVPFGIGGPMFEKDSTKIQALDPWQHQFAVAFQHLVGQHWSTLMGRG